MMYGTEVCCCTSLRYVQQQNQDQKGTTRWGNVITHLNRERDTVIACDICKEPILAKPAGVWWVNFYDKEYKIVRQEGPWFCHGSSYTGLLPCHFKMMARANVVAKNDGVTYGSVLDDDLHEWMTEVGFNVGVTTRFARKPRLATAEVTRCYLCQENLEGDIEMDHVLARSRGGDDSLLMPVHKECNRAKGNRHLMKRPGKKGPKGIDSA
jgi:5-methylcytosine-specific restriction endonuclease McrA